MKAPGVKLMKQQKIKKVPQRKCVGCGEMKDKKSLLRIVRSPEGEISLDLTGKKSGRGAYVCRSRECIKKAVKEKRLERALEKPELEYLAKSAGVNIITGPSRAEIGSAIGKSPRTAVVITDNNFAAMIQKKCHD